MSNSQTDSSLFEDIVQLIIIIMTAVAAAASGKMHVIEECREIRMLNLNLSY